MVCKNQDTGRDMDGGGFVAESEILSAAGDQFDGERVVFFVDWTGWYVLFFPLPFSFSLSLSFSPQRYVCGVGEEADIYGCGDETELSLTVPITNSLAFLFTVLGEWWAEGKVIGRDTWIGMAFVLGGIALCVQSKSSAG